ncbi:sulfite exporter TauE/SafE family protein [Aeropyrum pernix]|nr:sulfite exporter TauE/SafE family protein [Aeropyrum pernix]
MAPAPPDLSLADMALRILMGVAAASLASLSGVGGGVFFVPIFLFIVGLPPNIAVGSSKVVVAIVSIVSGLTYLRQGTTRISRAAPLMVSMIPGAALGAYLVAYIDPRLLEVILGLFITYYSFRLLLATARKALAREAKPVEEEGSRGPRPGGRYLMLATGVAAGLFAGLTGTGGGAILVPMLTLLRIAKLKEAVAISMLSISLGAVVSAAIHVWTGVVDFGAAAPFALGALVGSVLGPMAASRLSTDALRPIVALVLLLVALRLLF